ncbi:hypothetical protein FB45DRAFT_806248 [Roridomyces roridus]|uniref:MYND-type domain-containing protein n=1 Tax=Roridomyces roridus TaxID=1738132 RepID=A0AAD7FAC6_9AGAR|nr:hypothetical protein FB45DRAFT_806248 [Roridomyces roridus]
MQDSAARPTLGVHAIHPKNAETFKSVASTSEEIRTGRQSLQTACTNCHKLKENVRRCAKCKEAWYCSKECQKQHWPAHKVFCHPVEGSGIMKLVNNFSANPLLMLYLEAALIQKFDLLNNPRREPPHSARIDVGIEPAEIPDFLAVFEGQQTRTAEEMGGMMQINTIEPLKAIPSSQLSPERALIWNRTQESGAGQFCFGIIEFGNGESEQTIAAPMLIHPMAMEFVREAHPDTRTSALTGEVTIVPFSFDQCIEHMNMHIRADKKNQLLLRTALRASDIQAIRGAAENRSTRSAQAIRTKMAREPIYKPTRLTFVDARGNDGETSLSSLD